MQQLITFLDQNEAAFRTHYSGTAPAHPCLINNVQCYAYDTSVSYQKAKIAVICVGSNYATGPNQTIVSSPAPCAVNLKKWRTNYSKMVALFQQTNGWKAQWIQQKWSSSTFPTLSSSDHDFFFVMTNLCPWITTVDWSKLCPNSAKGFLAAARPRGQFDHLNALFQYLRQNKIPFVVVGHGINDNILGPLLNYLRSNHALDPWVQYANFTWPKSPKRWCSKQNRFIF
jgi:hypothetical protein